MNWYVHTYNISKTYAVARFRFTYLIIIIITIFFLFNFLLNRVLFASDHFLRPSLTPPFLLFLPLSFHRIFNTRVEFIFYVSTIF